MDLTSTISAVWPRLNSTAEADSVFWTATELWGYVDDEVKRLARETEAFVETATVGLVAGQTEYSLPARHVATVEVHSDGLTLQPIASRGLFAGDRRWKSATGDELDRFSADVVGGGTVALYPTPTATAVAADGFLRFVEAENPATVSAGSPSITAPEALRDLFAFTVLARARAKETPGAMPDVAEWCEAQAAMLRGVAVEVWG